MIQLDLQSLQMLLPTSKQLWSENTHKIFDSIFFLMYFTVHINDLWL